MSASDPSALVTDFPPSTPGSRADAIRIVGEMKVRFQKPAVTSLLVDARMTDEEIERVTEELEEHGRAKWVLDQEVVDEAGSVVATTSAVYFGMAHPG